MGSSQASRFFCTTSTMPRRFGPSVHQADIGAVFGFASAERGSGELLCEARGDGNAIVQYVPVIGIVSRQRGGDAPIDHLCSVLAADGSDARLAFRFHLGG